MTIRFPLRLVRQGPGYYLIDASERTVAVMNADKQDAEFILCACNAHDELLDIVRRLESLQVQRGTAFYVALDKLCSDARDTIAQAEASRES